MSLFKDIVKDMGNNLAEYGKGAWNLFLHQAANEMAGLSEYYIGVGKHASILASNLPYIEQSEKIVKGLDDKTNSQGRATFGYYSKIGIRHEKLTGTKPLLANPSSDRGVKEEEKFNPRQMTISHIYKANLDSINKSVSVVTGNNINENNNGRAKFGYYQHFKISDKLNNGSLSLAYPNADKGITEVEMVTRNSGGTTLFRAASAPLHLHYAEYESGSLTNYLTDEEDQYAAGWTLVKDSASGSSYSTLIEKTRGWFSDNKNDYISNRFETIISRFHTKNNKLSSNIGNLAFTKYGESHGRNLLKLNPDKSAGYTNPYCRVWTWHHQYHNLKDMIRPFRDESGNTMNQQEITKANRWYKFKASSSGRFDGGASRLTEYGVMTNNGGHFNGFVNITPVGYHDSIDKYKTVNGVAVEKCMFSIENLAWKNTFNDWNDDGFGLILSREQKGPLGGRIMWFPPYDISFNEQSSARWEENNFIGRGEPMYTYSNTSRSGSLHFKLLIDHPAILDFWDRRKKKQGEQYDGTEKKYGTGAVDDVDSKEQELLRFFAGCDILKGGQPKPPKPIQPPKPKPEPPEETNPSNVIQFFVFYPNNYSGKFDTGQPVNPIDYLINGIGAQKEELFLRFTQERVVVEFGVNMNEKITYKGTQYGGYEMRDNGISITTEPSTTNAILPVGEKVKIGSDREVVLMKQLGSEARKETEMKTTNKKWLKWQQKRWYYRVDAETANQVFNDKTSKSYIDKVSYKLNSNGFTEAVKYWGDSIENKEAMVSFADFYVAIKGDNSKILEGCYDADRVAMIKKVLSGELGKIKTIKCKGRASSQGNNASKKVNNTRNKNLAYNRAATIQKWLQDNIKGDGIEFKLDTFKVDRKKYKNQNDANDKEAKLNRFAFVEIVYDGVEVKPASETQATDEGNSTFTQNNIEYDLNDDVSGITRSLNESVMSIRYDEEAKFFERLTDEDPFMTRLLSERIRYFNPIFHSMSPEGFNARLTFLNQCMRQGPTNGALDTFGGNANNLSFGRAPVCVLRIGDFFNTKIIVTNLTINYDPLTWDLNEEGIGVMPMIADVTLSFNIIGGADLGGPIQRLQNAVSFNYYSNAGVYDNRSESIQYANGEPIAFKPFEINRS